MEPTKEQVHESNKVIRENLAWVHHKLQYLPTMPEEHQMHQAAIGVLFALCTDLQKKIEEVEPPEVKEELPKGAYVVDVPSRG